MTWTENFAANSPIPRYILIATAIQQSIEDGTYEPGVPLPTEDEFAESFGVSRATVRQGVGELVNRGLVVRRRGSGTYVLAAAKQRIGQRFRGSLIDLMSETKRAGVRDIDIQRSVAIPSRFATLLELEEPVGTIVRRTRLMDKTPFAYTINYLPNTHGSVLTKKDLRSESLMALLERSGVELQGARQSVHPQLATLELSERLELPYSGAPVLFVERLVWSSDETPVEVAQTWYRGDHYEYTVTFDMTRPTRDSSISRFA